MSKAKQKIDGGQQGKIKNHLKKVMEITKILEGLDRVEVASLLDATAGILFPDGDDKLEMVFTSRCRSH